MLLAQTNLSKSSTRGNSAHQNLPASRLDEEVFIILFPSVIRFRLPQEGRDLRYGSPLQQRQVLKELTAGDCLLTTLLAAGQQVLS